MFNNTVIIISYIVISVETSKAETSVQTNPNREKKQSHSSVQTTAVMVMNNFAVKIYNERFRLEPIH